MGLFQRIGDIITANLNDLIERCEDPEKLLRQVVREMEDALDASLDGAARAVGSERLLEKELAGHRSLTGECEERAAQALRANDLPQAHREVRRKFEYEKAAGLIAKELASARATGQALRRQVEDLREKLAEARRRLGLLAARKRVAQARRRSRVGAGEVRTAPSVRFERLARRIEEAEAEADGQAELEGTSAAPGDGGKEEERIAKLVEDELSAMRKRLGK